MPFRLIGTIILLIIVTVFAGFNMNNKSDINFVFYNLKEIPVFMTVIISFIIGVVVMIPFSLGLGKKKPKNKNQNTAPKVQPEGKEDNSKTLFDFKIRKEAKAEKKKPKTDEPKNAAQEQSEKNTDGE